jgi:hypothetical protein
VHTRQKVQAAKDPTRQTYLVTKAQCLPDPVSGNHHDSYCLGDSEVLLTMNPETGIAIMDHVGNDLIIRSRITQCCPPGSHRLARLGTYGTTGPQCPTAGLRYLPADHVTAASACQVRE